MAELDVDIVAVDRKVWSGKATFIFTRTTVGEIGIMPGHIPLVAELVDDAMVRVDRVEEDELRLAVHGGFLSVTDEGSAFWPNPSTSPRRSMRRQLATKPSPVIPRWPHRAEPGCAPWVSSISGA